MEQKYVIAWRAPGGESGESKNEYGFDECQARCDTLRRAWGGVVEYWPKAVAPETVDTSDLPTQPIVAIDAGE